MFHLVTYDSISRNIPLEELPRKSLKVAQTQAASSARKTFIDDRNDANDSESNHTRLNPAIDAYKKQAKISEKTLLLHAKDIMNSPVITIPVTALRKEAWQMMKEKNISHLPVLDGQKKIAGIISERDIMRGTIIENDRIISDATMAIKDIMCTEVITADPLTDIRRIAKAMFHNRISTMPIISDTDMLTGIVTRSDILHALIHYPDLQLWA